MAKKNVQVQVQVDQTKLGRLLKEYDALALERTEAAQIAEQAADRKKVPAILV